MKGNNGKGYDNKGNTIYELKNGIGNLKVYNSNGNIILEREFTNLQKYDTRYGKGKEYYEDNTLKLEFEGIYLYNEKWNGNAKEYDYEGNLIFEGKYLYGEKWKGIVKEYHENGKLYFEGEYLNMESKKKYKTI